MSRHTMLRIATAMATLSLARAIPLSHPYAPTTHNQTSLFPNNADTSHTTPQTASFFHNFFTAKSSFNASAWLSYFNPTQTDIFDSTIGLNANRSTWTTDVEGITQTWAQNSSSGRSYPLRILGDTTTGAVVYFVDTPPLFGAEIRSISSFDFLDGTVRRELDNWDGRGNPAVASLGVPADQFPYDLGLTGLPERAAEEMKTVAGKLNRALSTGDGTAAAALFSYDAVFEDLTLRTRVEGQIAIQAYLSRAVQQLPYGRGANLTHVLGNARGGGYEWRPSVGPVRYGITALELDRSGNITRFTAVWDGSRLNGTAIQTLAVLAVTS